MKETGHHPTARHVAITGATGGIGMAIARRFSAGGDVLHLLGRDATRLNALAEQLGAEVRTHTCDIGDAASLAATMAQLERLDVLVNSAGSIPRLSLAQTRPSDWRGSWSDKVLGTIEATRLACARMQETGGGVVVNIIGTAGVRPNPKSLMGTTANAALIAFTQAAGALSVDHNVRIVGINPGLTATPRTQGGASHSATGAAGAQEAFAQALANLPYGRMADASEVAEAAWFLASSSAAYISGTVIDVDAGARWRV
jgi:NAD(P)-dependent dehydrogenase (short-subunit alcohol dehydrogenase family)